MDTGHLMALSEWIDMLTPASARARSVDSDPASATYGQLTDGPAFAVGYQRMSSAEVQRIGRAYGSNMYMILCDLVNGAPPVGQHQTLNVDGLGDMDVHAVIDYQQPDYQMAKIEAEVRS